MSHRSFRNFAANRRKSRGPRALTSSEIREHLRIAECLIYFPVIGAHGGGYVWFIASPPSRVPSRMVGHQLVFDTGSIRKIDGPRAWRPHRLGQPAPLALRLSPGKARRVIAASERDGVPAFNMLEAFRR
jgi:hypothetical protein